MHFNVAKLEEDLKELQEEMAAPDFWNDLSRAQGINQKAKHTEDRLSSYHGMLSRLDDVDVLIDLAIEEDDEAVSADIEKEIAELFNEADMLRLETLLRGEYDHCEAILSLHAGAGGTEAQDWASMLYRMYTRYCERHGFKVTVLDYLDGDEAGIKSVTFQISGSNAYGYLKSEKGIHRLVRISPFDSNARRHTSFTSLDVTPVINDEIEVDIRSEDLRVDTYRSSGAGGQHINKTDSAVRITHIPTGVVVACQTQRSQVQNREVCMRMLRSKLVELKEREAMEKLSEIKGEMKKIEWGSQIRSYVFQPYTMVKDHRTGFEKGDVDSVMDGDLDPFITAFLQMM